MKVGGLQLHDVAGDIARDARPSAWMVVGFASPPKVIGVAKPPQGLDDFVFGGCYRLNAGSCQEPRKK